MKSRTPPATAHTNRVRRRSVADRTAGSRASAAAPSPAATRRATATQAVAQRRGAGFRGVDAVCGPGAGFGLRVDVGRLVVAVRFGFVAYRVGVRVRRLVVARRVELVGVVGTVLAAEPFPSHG